MFAWVSAALATPPEESKRAQGDRYERNKGWFGSGLRSLAGLQVESGKHQLGSIERRIVIGENTQTRSLQAE
jgi:hypothetical protein